jgi:hypothetical protein
MILAGQKRSAVSWSSGWPNPNDGAKGNPPPWTETENKELAQMLQARKSTAEIAAKLDRTQQAIYP